MRRIRGVLIARRRIFECGLTQPKRNYFSNGNTILPPTIVYLTFPFNSFPIKGLFLDLDTIISFVYVYVSFGSKIVISAILPSSIVPLSIFNNFAGLYDVTLTKSK